MPGEISTIPYRPTVCPQTPHSQVLESRMYGKMEAQPNSIFNLGNPVFLK